MSSHPTRPAAVAGSWYPGHPGALAAEVDRYLGAVQGLPSGDVVGIVAPHAGLMFSGPVGAYAYRLVANRPYDAVVMIGPSHHVAFSGVAVDRRAGWETPFGVAPIARDLVSALMAATALARDLPGAHAREHSLEMQMPFLMRVLPGVPIVPLVMGHQECDTVNEVAAALVTVLEGRRPLLVASSDLSHYKPADEASVLDRRVLDLVAAFDADGLMAALERQHEHACGGGPIACVMRASRLLGAVEARVLHYADSGDVSGDKSAVVGYAAAAFGTFAAAAPGPVTVH